MLHVRVARRRVSSGLCRRAPHPRRQSAWVSSGESLFGTSGANRSTKLAQLRGCDSAMARRGRGRGSGSSTLCFTFPTFVKGGKGGKQRVRRKRVCTDTLACEALTCTRLSRTLFPQDMDVGAKEAPRRTLNIAAALSYFALLSGTQSSHCACVVVLVSHSRATSCVAFSTCQQSLLAVAVGVSTHSCWMYLGRRFPQVRKGNSRG